MSELPKVVREYGGIGALITVLLGGGANIWQEGAEEGVTTAIRADYAELLQKFNDLSTEVALLRQAIEFRIP